MGCRSSPTTGSKRLVAPLELTRDANLFPRRTSLRWRRRGRVRSRKMSIWKTCTKQWRTTRQQWMYSNGRYEMSVGDAVHVLKAPPAFGTKRKKMLRTHRQVMVAFNRPVHASLVDTTRHEQDVVSNQEGLFRCSLGSELFSKRDKKGPAVLFRATAMWWVQH